MSFKKSKAATSRLANPGPQLSSPVPLAIVGQQSWEALVLSVGLCKLRVWGNAVADGVGLERLLSGVRTEWSQLLEGRGLIKMKWSQYIFIPPFLRGAPRSIHNLSLTPLYLHKNNVR